METSSYKNTITPGRVGAVAIAAFMMAGTAGRAQSEYDPGWTKNLRVGAISGFNIKGNFKVSGQFPVGGNNPGPTGVSGADHVYDDGYVRLDETGNAQGYTSFWGYESAAQYNAGSGQLLMHSTTSFTGQGGGSADNDFSIGAELAYGGVIKRWERTRLGWEFGFGWLPFEISESSPFAALVNRDTYAFDTGGIILPGAPFSGGSSGLGPTIRDVATLVGSDTAPGLVQGSQALDVDLFIFRLGPTFFYDVSRRVGVMVSAGPAAALVSQTYNYSESITFTDGSTASNHGSFSDSEFVYGGYVSVLGTYHVEAGGDIYLGFQYMPLSDSAISQSGREGSLDFSGQFLISAGINWTF
jgi:hypothetical protein